MRTKLLCTLVLSILYCGTVVADPVGYNLTNTTLSVAGLNAPSTIQAVPYTGGTTAYYFQDNQQPVGTGVFAPFLRIQQNGTEEGYNTDAHNPHPPLDDVAGIWTHSLLLSTLPVVHYQGQDYFRFYLDINETASQTNPLLSLDELQIFTSTTNSVTNPTFAAGTHILQGTGLGTLRYDLDGNGHDNYVLLDYSISQCGSGCSDMNVLIPKFSGAPGETYVTFYSQFGLQGINPSGPTDARIEGADSSAGFEEWAAFTRLPEPPCDNCGGNEVPEPASLVLLGSGFLGLAGFLRRRLS